MFTELFPDLCDHVCTFVSSEDLFSSRRVCKKWRDHLDRSEVWRKVAINQVHSFAFPIDNYEAFLRENAQFHIDFPTTVYPPRSPPHTAFEFLVEIFKNNEKQMEFQWRGGNFPFIEDESWFSEIFQHDYFAKLHILFHGSRKQYRCLHLVKNIHRWRYDEEQFTDANPQNSSQFIWRSEEDIALTFNRTLDAGNMFLLAYEGDFCEANHNSRDLMELLNFVS